MWNNVVNAWWPLVFYPATDAPKFTKGMWAMIGVSIVTLGVTWLVWYLERREKRIKTKRGFIQRNVEESSREKGEEGEEKERASYEQKDEKGGSEK